MFSEDYEHAHIGEKNDPTRIKTIEACISGQVQGVGFRGCVKKIASGLCITGKVKNLDDGRVYLLATGESAIIEKMLSSMYECPRAYIRDIKTRELKVIESDDFRVVRMQ